MTAPSLTPLEALTVEAFGLTLDEENDFDIQCEHPHHITGKFGHDDGPARYAFTCPACKTMALLCEGSSAFTISFGSTRCPYTKGRVIVTAADFVPLGGDHA